MPPHEASNGTQSQSVPLPAKVKKAKEGHWFTRLFFRRKFGVHRICGLTFLVQFVWACALYVLDYEAFKRSHLLWSLPLTGVIQSVTAIYTFTFLNKSDEPGFVAMGDKAVLSYNFIKENSFFEGLLGFQWLYYSDMFFPLMSNFLPVEALGVFLPYFIRPLWPTTRFRTALANNKNKTDANRNWFIFSTYVVKVFYLFAKHYIGFFLNYLRFMGRVSPSTQHLVHGILLTSCYATTIAIFLHTLKFKGYIGARTATLAYEGSYVFVAYFYYCLLGVIATNWDLALICAVAIVVNVASLRGWHAYQIAVMALLYYAKAGMIDLKTLTLA